MSATSPDQLDTEPSAPVGAVIAEELSSLETEHWSGELSQLIEPEVREIGQSREGRPINAVRSGTPGGIPVLAVGVIHGDEPAGLRVIEHIRSLSLPDGIELWTIDTVNPDGLLATTRGNAAGVDLNRNFDSGDWAPVGDGTTRYSGPFPASELETAVVQRFLDEVRPRFAVWWHQVGNHVDDNDAVADYGLLETFAELTGMQRLVTPCGTPCVGTATAYLNLRHGSTSFVVELPASVDAPLVERQAIAFVETATTLLGDLAR